MHRVSFVLLAALFGAVNVANAGFVDNRSAPSTEIVVSYNGVAPEDLVAGGGAAPD